MNMQGCPQNLQAWSQIRATALSLLLNAWLGSLLKAELAPLADAMSLTMIPAGPFSFLSLFLAETRHALHFSLQVRNPDVKAPDFCFCLPAEYPSLTSTWSVLLYLQRLAKVNAPGSVNGERNVEAEVVSNSRNKIKQTLAWARLLDAVKRGAIKFLHV